MKKVHLKRAEEEDRRRKRGPSQGENKAKKDRSKLRSFFSNAILMGGNGISLCGEVLFPQFFLEMDQKLVTNILHLTQCRNPSRVDSMM